MSSGVLKQLLLLLLEIFGKGRPWARSDDLHFEIHLSPYARIVLPSSNFVKKFKFGIIMVLVVLADACTVCR